MADAKNAADKPKRKPQVRNNKPKVVFIAYKGQLESVEVFTDRDKVMEKLLEANMAGDTSLRMQKVELPKGKPRAKAGDQPTAPAA